MAAKCAKRDLEGGNTLRAKKTNDGIFDVHAGLRKTGIETAALTRDRAVQDSRVVERENFKFAGDVVHSLGSCQNRPRNRIVTFEERQVAMGLAEIQKEPTLGSKVLEDRIQNLTGGSKVLQDRI